MGNLIKRICASIFFAAAVLFSSCNFLSEVTGVNEKKVEITALSLSKPTLSIKAGSMDYVGVTVKPQNEQKNVKLNWSYDKTIIECDTSSAWGVTIKALKEGQTSLRCSYGGYDANCLVTVSGFAEGYEETTEPYIYSNTTILQTSPGITERVYVSLYGGSAADIDGYTWTCENTSVCGIQPTGQYCMVTAKEPGYARIKITHQKAPYPYYMGIYVFDDAMNMTYITTSNNIVTMKQGDTSQNITVSLVNGKQTSLDSQFRWEVLNDSVDCPIGLQYNGNNAVATPIRSGSCTLRITHPDAAYPLEILCRVITVVKNVYIKPSESVVNLSGENTHTLTCTLENIKTGEYDIDAYEYTLDDYNVAEIVSSVGEQVILKGKGNGSCKLIINHESAKYAREVLVIVEGQLNDAIDASCYITTSQNYIRTKVGAEGTRINISLKGGDDGDETAFSWKITSTAADGSNARVISMDTTHGAASYSRMAAQTYIAGEAFIEPLAEGTAVIQVTHPKAAYPTEILVKVLNKDAVLEEPLYFAGNGLVKILNGNTADYEVRLLGKNKNAADDYSIRWSCDDSRLRLSPSGNTVSITAPNLGTGQTTSTITASHNKADSDKKVLVMTADDEETLESMRALYSDKLCYNIGVGEKAYFMTIAAGFDTVDSNGNDVEYDFSSARWTVANPAVVSIEKSDYNPLTGIATGLKAGATTVTVTIDGYSCEYTVTVYPEGAIQTTPEVYFTTGKNVITIGKRGDSETAYVTAVNLKTNEYSNIAWSSSDTNVASVIPNGTRATINAVGEGEAVISVAHPDSQNTMKIYVRVGSEYIAKPTDPVVYISSQDVVTMLRDDSAQRLDAVLVNYTGADTSGFRFSIDDEDVASITSQSTNGIAYVKPLASGQAEITISHPKAQFAKKVLVVVGNSAEELAGITYLTTSSNVVAVGEGQTKNVTVAVKNSETTVLDGYTWTSSAPSIVDVTATGATAVFTGNSIGTAVITVTNKYCRYSLQIIAQCVDPIAAAENPYIQLTSSVITVNVSSNYTSVTADLVGGKESDLANFIWTSNDSSICAVYGQNHVGKLRALKAGTTYITVSHPKAMYSAQLLVVCDEVKESECYISVPSSIMNMKPTDPVQTITASLINGTSTDKYSFSWSLDVYDVVDFVFSANVCTITPKQQGQCTITVRHPKAAYDQQIIVTVQEYSDFAFPSSNMTMTQGDVKFITMQVPNTKVTTHIEYSVDKSDICSITGTKSTAQITGVGTGTTIVRAKLVASGSGATQAETEMMVYVKKADVDAVYITSASTINTVSKGKSKTLSAVLSGTGVTNEDQYNLVWTTGDTDVIKITGISSNGTIKGESIYITALKAGEALITCSHPKAQSDLQFYVVVPGAAEKSIALNKTFVTIMKGSSGTTLKASIDNAESSNDYHDIEWSVSNVGNDEVCRVMGGGQTVTIYPINVGEAEVIAQLPDSDKVAKCTVKVEASKSFVFESSAAKVTPFHAKKYKYTVSPPDAVLTWNVIQADDYFSYKDLGCDEKGVGYVEIEGIREGTGSLVCLTDGGAKGQLSVRIAWDYSFVLSGKTAIATTPEEITEIEYSVNPPDAEIEIASTANSTVDKTFEATVVGNTSTGKGTITITPLKETKGNIQIVITATNPNNGNERVGSKTITALFGYGKKLTPIVTKKPLGNNMDHFSEWDGEMIHFGDGETYQFTLGFKESKLDVSAVTASLSNQSNSGLEVNVLPNKNADGTYTIKLLPSDDPSKPSGDLQEEVFYLKTLKVPVYNGPSLDKWTRDGKQLVKGAEIAVITSNGELTDNFEWWQTRDYGGNKVDTYGLALPGVTREGWYDNNDESKYLIKVNESQPKGSQFAAATYYLYTSIDYGAYTHTMAWNPNFYLRDYDLSKLTYNERCIRKTDFYNNAWFYCPGTGDYWTRMCRKISYNEPTNNRNAMGMAAGGPHIMTAHVSIDKVMSRDTSIVQICEGGILTLTCSTSNGDRIVQLPIQIERRTCAAGDNEED